MARQIQVRSDWRRHVVATRNRGGIQVLLGIRKSRCEICGHGIHFDTLWGSSIGEGQRITWCGSCFNAECSRAEIDETARHQCRDLVESIDSQPPATYWSCARPAIEDLERRGLV